MNSKREALMEKMRARRVQLKDTIDTDNESSPRQKSSETWAENVDDEEGSVDRTTDSGTHDIASMEVEDEVQQSELLVDNLKKRRKRTQKELSRTLKTSEGDDIHEEMRSAKLRTKQRFMDETTRSATEGEETAGSADAEDSMHIPSLDIGDDRSAHDGSPPTTSRGTARTPRSARDESMTPRRVSTTLASSIRAKLSQKLRQAKDKGKDEAYDESRQVERRLQGKRVMGRSTRFDDPSVIREEDVEAEAQLEKSFQVKQKWKDVIDSAAGDKVALPSQDEAFDFFTRQFEAEEEPEESKAESEAPDGEEAGAAGTESGADEARREEGAAAGEDVEADEQDARKKKRKKKEPKSEDEEPLITEIDTSQDAWKLYEVSRAEYTPFHDKMGHEEKVYFVPSVVTSDEEKNLITGQEQPRYLEDEGFYVGVRPNVPPKNLNKMENRLLKEGENSRPWFGEDGQLIALPDPLKEVPSRPLIVEEVDPAIQVEYKKAILSDLDGRIIDRNQEGRGHYQLDVDINTLVFSHHHLFSKEHVLSSRLSDMYQQYVSRSKKKVADFMTEKLKALKSASEHIQRTINTMQSDDHVNPTSLADQQKRLKDYKDEIKQSRKQRDDEMLADRLLSKHIIQTWKDIKSLRQTQNFINTAAKLVIRKEPTDKATDEADLEQEIQDELQDIKDEAEQEYNSSLGAYKKQLDDWKKQRLDKKEAHKRQKKRDRRSTRGTNPEEDDVEMDQADKDKEVLEAEEIIKPEKPKLMSDSEGRQKIMDRYSEIRRKPGEPKLYFELTYSANVTSKDTCPPEEKQRRNDVSRHKMYVKVLFNSKEVSQTSPKTLSQDFTVRFTQIFNIEIMQWPESIKIEIYETVGIGSVLIAEVYAAIPDSNITIDSVILDEIEFSSDIIKNHPHAAVGSGLLPRSQQSDFEVILMTSGMLSNSVAWAVDSQGNVLIPPQSSRDNQMYSAMKGMDAVAAIGVSGMSDMDKLTKWIAESHLDPNDPSNAELMCLMRPSGGGDPLITGFKMPDHFRLEQLQEEFNFATDDDVDSSLRFRMIQLREKEVQAFRNKTIPLFDKEIPDEVFAEYEKQKKAEEKLKRMDDEESHRVAVAKFMQKVREQVMIRFRFLQHQKTLQEMVYEDAVPNIGTIIPSLVKLIEPKRPLRIVRKERKKVAAPNLQGVDVKLLVNIVRAFGIPVRAGESQSTDQSVNTGGGTSRQQGGRNLRNIVGETQVRPYVEVMFQRNTQATSVADGPNPSWNEELALNFKPPNNDFSPSNLQTIRDIVYLNIFDEYIVDVVQDDRERGSSIHRRIEKRWLGTLKVPFSTIYFNSRVEGTFRIDKPPVLLGYNHEGKRGRGEQDLDIGVGDVNSTYVTLFITVDPPLPSSEPVREKFDSNEDEKLLQAADTWQYDLEKKFPKREFKSTVVDINGKSVFITRYIRSLKPPEELLKDDDNARTKAEAIARYVSMIPFVSDSVIFPGLCDIWSTCDQFLQMLQGDEEEHAVLLANYFLFLNKTVFLLLGSAIPEGPTAYVLTREGNDWWLWNASTGEHFSYRDNYCPVQRIGCLVTADNIWANIQPHDQPNRISYEVSNQKHWKPFFHKGFHNPGISSIQPSELTYIPTDRSYVLDLSEKIERALKEKIMEWRSRYITRWNRYCMQAFRRLLPKLEEHRGKYNLQQEHSQEMDQILGSYKLCGFPVNLPYTEMEPIIDAVFATGVHNYDSSEVEFALAVHIHPYPNSVLSVWAYVANLVRKR